MCGRSTTDGRSRRAATSVRLSSISTPSARTAAPTSRARSRRRLPPTRPRAGFRSCSSSRTVRRPSAKRDPTQSSSAPPICAGNAGSSPSASAPMSTRRCLNSSRCRGAAPRRSFAPRSPSSAPSGWTDRLARPVATDVHIHADGVRLYGLEPQGAVDLFAGQDLVVLARYSGTREDATLVIEGRNSDGPVRWTGHVSFPGHATENAFVARLWAAQRVGYLSAERHRIGGNAELDAELRQLGERYGIPTELTSYLVTEHGALSATGMPGAGG